MQTKKWLGLTNAMRNKASSKMELQSTLNFGNWEWLETSDKQENGRLCGLLGTNPI